MEVNQPNYYLELRRMPKMNFWTFLFWMTIFVMLLAFIPTLIIIGVLIYLIYKFYKHKRGGE